MRNNLIVFFLMIFQLIYSQTEYSIPSYFNLSYTNPDVYTIKDIKVNGVKFLDPSTIVSISGLRIGADVKIPGDNIQNALYKLWEQGFIEDVKINVLSIYGKEIILEINVIERPRLSGFTFKGIRKSEEDDIKNKVKLIKGKIVTDAIKKNTQSAIKKYLFEKGFSNAQVIISEQKDSTFSNSVQLLIDVHKNKKVKIKSVEIEGNSIYSDKKLISKFKKTKPKGFLKFYQTHKFNNKLYEEDKQKLIAFYQNNGYRDIEIVSDTTFYYPAEKIKNDKRYLGIKLTVSEGKKYYFRNINWEGNNLYSDSLLSRILNIKKGTVYNKEILDSRLTFNPNGTDVSSLYLDDGYLFFTVDPVEVKIENDSVDIEMRIYEGTQVTIDKINIFGNTKTNDHVILREIRTKPGEKFSRADLVLTQRILSQMGYFNPEKIDIQPVPNAQKGTVDINYTVEEKPSDQIQLSGSVGGFGVLGSVGLTFNNFSARNINKFKKWDPLPAGDGQRLGINMQSNGAYTSYSFSFTEPWLGGKKPNSLSVSLSRSSQDPSKQTALSRNQNSYYSMLGSGSKFKVTNATISLAKQLSAIDWRLSWSNSISYSRYSLVNYTIGTYIDPVTNESTRLQDGDFNNFNFNTTLSRNSLDDATYPKAGSSITTSLSLTPPYSLFKSASKLSSESVYEKFKFVEYNKLMVDYSYFTKIVGKLVVNTRAHFGILGGYNPKIGPGMFERFSLGGNGLSGMNFILGYDLIPLRGYATNFLNTANKGVSAVAYNKFVAEVRYPISLNPMATVYVLGFGEAGNAFASSKDYNPFQLYRSAGVGARIFMPAFGMIGLDYATPFDQVPGGGAEFKTGNYYNRFIFTIGQQLR